MEASAPLVATDLPASAGRRLRRTLGQAAANGLEALVVPAGAGLGSIVLFGISIATASLPRISSHAAANDDAGIRQSVSIGLRMMLMLNVPATAGLMALAVLEHIFMILPIPVASLWRWSMRSGDRVEPAVTIPSSTAEKVPLIPKP